MIKYSHPSLHRTRKQKVINNIIFIALFLITVLVVSTVLVVPKLENTLFTDGSATSLPVIQYRMYSALWISSYHIGLLGKEFDGTSFSWIGITVLTIVCLGLALGVVKNITVIRHIIIWKGKKFDYDRQKVAWELIFTTLSVVIMLVFLIISILSEPNADSKEIFFYAIPTSERSATFPDGSGGEFTIPIPYTFAETATSIGSILIFSSFGILILNGGIGAIALKTNSFNQW